MSRRVIGRRVAATVLAITSLAAWSAASSGAGASGPTVTAGSGHLLRGGRAGLRGTGGNLIDHQGPVLGASTTVPIWWGSSFSADTTRATTDFLSHLNGSAYLGIAQQYMRGTSITTSLGRQYTDTTRPPPAHSPKVSDIVTEVVNVVGAANVDPAAVYLVFTSNFPTGASFCAWHSSGTVNGVPVQVAYLPNVGAVAGCQSPVQASGNSYDAPTQALTDDTAHELMETITDPRLNAWYDKSGSEIGDKCQTVYSPVVLGSTTWDVQQEWSNTAGGCVSG